MYTEVLQTVVLLAGGVVLMAASLIKVGGLEGLHSQINEPNYFHIFRYILHSICSLPFFTGKLKNQRMSIF